MGVNIATKKQETHPGGVFPALRNYIIKKEQSKENLFPSTCLY